MIVKKRIFTYVALTYKLKTKKPLCRNGFLTPLQHWI